VRFLVWGINTMRSFQEAYLSSQEIILPQHGNQQLRKALTAEIEIGHKNSGCYYTFAYSPWKNKI
jgi:hypothetical protein